VDEVVIHTDGGCRGNPGPGAWAAVLRSGDRGRELVGTEAETTNNRMELMAAIKALESLKRPCRARMVTDSKYLKSGITEWLPNWIENGWKNSRRKPVLNRDLWERLRRLCEGHDVRWEWVEGHAGVPDNERCDRLLNEALDRLQRNSPGW